MNPSFLPSLFFNDCWQRCPTPFIIKRLLRYRQDRGGFSALLLSGDIYFLEALSLSLSLLLLGTSPSVHHRPFTWSPLSLCRPFVVVTLKVQARPVY